MDAPQFARPSHVKGNQERVADIHPTFSRGGASALMECAGWFLNNAASSKLVIHARFDQPRSYLFCHQRFDCHSNLWKSSIAHCRCLAVRRFGGVKAGRVSARPKGLALMPTKCPHAGGASDAATLPHPTCGLAAAPEERCLLLPWRALSCNGDRLYWPRAGVFEMSRLVDLARCQKRPCQARVLVGHGNGGDIVMTATGKLPEPSSSAIGTCLGELHQRS